MELEKPQMGLTFERVWATIERIAERHGELAERHRELAERHEETDRFLKESKAETDRTIKELAEQHKETDRTITKMNRDLNQAIGKLGNRFGELIERLVSPNLLEKFNALGFAFTKINTRVEYKAPKTGVTLAEVDALLENDGCALAVEIKADPSIEDAKSHERRMETLRRYADAHGDKRGYIGAIAGGIVSEEVKSYALKRGFYVLEQSGDTMNIAATPDAWKPKRW
ncbi:MAG: hypothetical protein LBF60_04990 [Treponema sp.]|jgi:hypothetical protein|nr:hypothetical protein [Treponema sp.]